MSLISLATSRRRSFMKRRCSTMSLSEMEVTDTHKLSVHLKNGENMIPCDSNGKSDPYVKFKLDESTVYKSRCCPSTLEPKWDEHFTLTLDPYKQQLSVHVYDRDRGFRDDFMGWAIIDTHQLIQEKEKELKLYLRNHKSLLNLNASGSSQEDEDDYAADMGHINLKISIENLPNYENNPTVSHFGSNSSLVSIERQTTIVESTESAVFDEVKQPVTKSPSHERRGSTLTHQSSSASINESKKPTPTLRKRADTKSTRKGHHSTSLAVATVCLVSGNDLPARDANGFSDPYVKLQLGKYKRKSKTCYKTLNPVWKEEYVLMLDSPESSTLQIEVWDKDSYRKDDFIGKIEQDVWSLEREVTHRLTLNLVDASGSLCLLVTVQDCDPEHRDLTAYDLQLLRKRYEINQTFKDLKDVGFAEVQVISASGLKSADYCGKSDPFCIVKLCNAHVHTHTCYKTLEPVWNRTFTFPILDIHDAFEFLVYDADNLEGRDFLGRVSIPILEARNGMKETYNLKNFKLNGDAKGSISVQINYIYNPLRAALRTFKPKEEDLMEENIKFKKTKLSNNFQRVWKLVQSIIFAAQFLKSLFTWESPKRSLIAFVAFVMIVWNFEIYMFPITLLLLFFKNYYDIHIRKSRLTPSEALIKASGASGSEDDEDDDKQSLIRKINAIQEVLTEVQHILDVIASFGERCHNAVTWSVPYLGWLAVIVVFLASLILYFVPFRLVVLLWGINKFTKKLRNPNYVDNNELLDYLSRVPSNVQLNQFKNSSSQVKLSPGNSRKKRN